MAEILGAVAALVGLAAGGKVFLARGNKPQIVISIAPPLQEKPETERQRVEREAELKIERIVFEEGPGLPIVPVPFAAPGFGGVSVNPTAFKPLPLFIKVGGFVGEVPPQLQEAEPAAPILDPLLLGRMVQL